MSSFSSMKPLILSLVFLSCFLGTLQANIEQHYHTIEVSSLLPASTCNSLTKGTKSISSQSTTLEVTHRHGPCSKQTLENSAEPSLDDILSQDQARVETIQARFKPGPKTPGGTKPANPNNNNNNNSKQQTLIDQEDANLPARSGSSLSSGNYVVTVGLGTPKTSLSMIFDTGSDLTWTQCEPCAGSCYPQQDPTFDPTRSSTYSNASCSSPQCQQLSSATGVSPRCARPDTCVYGVQYGDRSFSEGFLSADTLALTPSDAFPNFYFGCGQNNQGLFGKTAGLIGLGRDPLSLVSQTAQKYGKYFSYCLPSTSSSVGFLTFGGGSASNNLKFTPFSSSQGNEYYFFDIESIYVGGQQLPISQTVFSSAGSIIDSGTVITRLPPPAYGAMSSAFKKLMQRYKRAPAFSILDTCFDFGGETSVSIPTVAFGFGGNVKVDLDPSGILILVNTTQACLAFAGNSGSTDVGIFGNIQQKTFEVAYDVDGGKLGFGASGCN